jgi:hypothetical protein
MINPDFYGLIGGKLNVSKALGALDKRLRVAIMG